jgi:NAD(P)-dependent dehydrogenase (short-subunit alcohol dehydrogenase family)
LLQLAGSDIRARQANPRMNAQIMAKVPMGGWGKPGEVGELAVFLCSEEAVFITGVHIVIDGGWCAQ